MKKIILLVTIFALNNAIVDANGAPLRQLADGRTKDFAFANLSLYPVPTGGSDLMGNRTSYIDDDTSISLIESEYKAAVSRLKQQAASIREYARVNQFNTEICFLVDMSIHSGKKRFFVYNLKKDSVVNSSLVAHGWGSIQPDSDQLIFSNTPNSCQTSLGKYKVGYSYNGSFGRAFKLYGLDRTNSKAFERAIVLHSLAEVPDSETYPEDICNSAGCPMVSPSFLKTLDGYITSSRKPVLLWIYN
jgi:hypothetical protein